MGHNDRTPRPIAEAIPLEPIENLTFAGGGVKGIAYVGVLEELEARGILKDVKRVGGTSAGGITSLLVGLGFSPRQIKKIMWAIDLRDFQDVGREFWEELLKKFGFSKIVAGMDVIDLLKIVSKDKHGLSKGEAFHNFAKKLIAERLGNPDATFADLKAAMRVDPTLKEITVCACDISGIGTAKTFFSVETTPNVKIADAVRATMSYPGAFEPFDIEMPDGLMHTFVDGGLVLNDPREFYDQYPVERTLGMRVDAVDSVNRFKWNIPGEKKSLEKVKDFVGGLARAGIEEALKGKYKLREKYGMVTIQIPDIGLKPLDFDIDADKKNRLIREGKKSTREWLHLYRSPEIVKDIIYHENLKEKYRTKNDKQKVEAVRHLHAEYAELESEISKLQRELLEVSTEDLRDEIEGSMAELDHRKQEIKEELSVIRELSPEVFKVKSLHDMLLEQAKNLLKVQAKLAEKNEAGLKEMQAAYADSIEQFRELYDFTANRIEVFEELLRDPLMKKSMEELLSKVRVFQRRCQKLRQEISDHELFYREPDPRHKKELSDLIANEPKRILRTAQSLLSQSEILDRHGAQSVKFALGIIGSELERVKKDRRDRKEKDLATLLLDCKRQKNDDYHTLTELIGAKQKCDVEIKLLNEKRKVLEYNRKLVGNNYEKIVTLAMNLTRFTEEQGTRGVVVYEGFAKAAGSVLQKLNDATFGLVPMIGAVVGFIPGWIGKKIAKATGLAKWALETGKLENIFVPNKVLYRREAQKFRAEIQKIIDQMGSKEPQKVLKAYDELLEKQKLSLERGIKLTAVESQKKLLNWIESSKTTLSRVARLEAELQDVGVEGKLERKHEIKPALKLETHDTEMESRLQARPRGPETKRETKLQAKPKNGRELKRGTKEIDREIKETKRGIKETKREFRRDSLGELVPERKFLEQKTRDEFDKIPRSTEKPTQRPRSNKWPPRPGPKKVR